MVCPAGKDDVIDITTLHYKCFCCWAVLSSAHLVYLLSCEIHYTYFLFSPPAHCHDITAQEKSSVFLATPATRQADKKKKGPIYNEISSFLVCLKSFSAAAVVLPKTLISRIITPWSDSLIGAVAEEKKLCCAPVLTLSIPFRKAALGCLVESKFSTCTQQCLPHQLVLKLV